MTTEVLTLSLTGGAQYTAGAGRILYLKSATDPVTITLVKQGTASVIRHFVNISAGFKFRAADGAPGWDYCRIDSAASQTLELVIGDDDVDFSNSVSVAGSVAAFPTSSAIAGGADVTGLAAAATDSTTIPANTARKRIWVGVLSTKTQGVRVRKHGAAAGGFEIQPGIFQPFSTTAALDVYNPGPAAADWYWMEET